MRFVIGLCGVLLVSGCMTNKGPGLIPEQRFSYNESFIRSQNEQMLLNLVRLRYNDTPLFLELNSIVTQLTLQNNGTFGTSFSLTNQADSKASAVTNPSLSAGMTFSEKPTLSFSPLQGEDFARQILTPIAPETLVLLAQSGWSNARLLSLSVQSINGIPNAPTAAGPTPRQSPTYEKFQELARLLREAQQSGAITIESSGEEGSKGIHWVFKQGNGSLKKIRELLGLSPEATRYRIQQAAQGGGADSIALETRSLLGVLFFLSHGVDVPTRHQEAGVAQTTVTDQGAAFDWNQVLGPLLRVNASEEEPETSFVKVGYRNHWYFIADSDINSKSTFGLLNYLYALQSAEGKGTSPLLTLSASQ